MIRQHTLKEFGRDERGSAMVEYVLTLPLFLAALAFAFEFGQLFLAHQETVNNVRSAARYLSRVPLTNANENRAERIIRTGTPNNGGATPDFLRDACRPPAPDCVTWTSTQITLQVRVDYPLTLFSLIGGDTRATIPFVVTEKIRPVGM